MGDTYIFDIETGPVEEEELRRVYKPAEAKPCPSPFNPDEVKLGGLKDKEKIAAKIAEAKAKREKEIAEYEANALESADKHWADFCDKAALSATTGQVLCIGVMGIQGVTVIDEGSEADIISKFWRMTDFGAVNTTRQYIGFNIEEFDLPFLARRSWKLGLEVPAWACPEGGRWFGKHVVDLRARWRHGNHKEQVGTLDDICQFFGIEGKLKGEDGESLGKQFHLLWQSDRKLAREYVIQDLKATCEVAKRLRVV